MLDFPVMNANNFHFLLQTNESYNLQMCSRGNPENKEAEKSDRRVPSKDQRLSGL